MKLQERIARNDIDDQIYLGGVVEKATSGEFGDLYRLICNGITAETLAESRINAKMSADRYLGRLEALDMIQEKLILMIDLKNRLKEEKKEEQKI